MSPEALSGYVEAAAAKFGIPGVAAGVWADGREDYACHGMTSVDNPLPVDRDTLYVLGSVTKTYTATALMRLAAAGQIDLDAPVRRYVPELVLADEQTAAQVTVMNLLNHTSGRHRNRRRRPDTPPDPAGHHPQHPRAETPGPSCAAPERSRSARTFSRSTSPSAWSRHEPSVAERLRRVDNRRMDYLRALFGTFCTDPAEARSMLAFSLLIGNHFMAADHGARIRAEVLEVAATWLLA